MSRLPQVALALALLLSTPVVSAELVLSSELPLTTLSYAPMPAAVSGIAAGDSYALAVWRDGRSVAESGRAARIDSAGHVADAGGLPIDGWPFAVAASDDGWLVLSSSPVMSSRLAQRIASDGSRSPSFVVPSLEQPAVLAWRDARFLVLSAPYGVSGLNGIFLDRDGRPGGEFRLSPGGAEPLQPKALAVTNAGFLLFYVQGNALFVVPLDPHGEMTASPAVVEANVYPFDRVSVAGSGTGVVAAWRDQSLRVETAIVDSAGEVRGAVNLIGNGINPVVAGVPGQFRLFYRAVVDGSYVGETRRVTLDENGGPASGEVVMCGAVSHATALNGTVVVAWDAPAGANTAQTTVRYRVGNDDTAPVLDCGEILSRGPARQEGIEVASAGDEVTAVWTEGAIDNEEQIMASFWRGSAPHRTEPVRIGTGTNPAVARDGDSSLFVWTEGARVLGKLATDRVLGETFELETTNGQNPAVAATAGGFVVVWHSLTTSAIAGAAVTREGEVRPFEGNLPARTLTVPPSPRVACGAGECVVAWRDDVGQPPFNTHSEVVAARVTSEGQVLDVVPVTIDTYAGGGREANVDISRGAGGFLVVVTRDDEIRRVVIDADVVVRSRFADAARALIPLRPRIAAAGDGWLVSWLAFDTFQVFLQQVRADGSSVTEPLVVANASPEKAWYYGGGAAVVWAGDRALIAYSAVREGEEQGSLRLFTRAVQASRTRPVERGGRRRGVERD